MNGLENKYIIKNITLAVRYISECNRQESYQHTTAH